MSNNFACWPAALLFAAGFFYFVYRLLRAALDVVYTVRRCSRGYSVLELIFVLLFISLIAGFAVPTLRSANRAGNERNAMVVLLSVAHAEQSYHAFTNSYTDAATLEAKKLLPGIALPVLQRNYMFSLAAGTDFFGAQAVPYDPTANPRSFWIDQSLVLRFCDACAADAGSAPYTH